MKLKMFQRRKYNHPHRYRPEKPAVKEKQYMREGLQIEWKKNVCYISIYLCICVCIYIYIYMNNSNLNGKKKIYICKYP